MADSRTETERIRRIYDRRAGDLRESRESGHLREVRRWLAGHAEGAVLEVGIGKGATIPYYRPEVDLTGVELSPACLSVARQRAAALGRRADLRLGDATALPFPDEHFDTVVFSFVLCTVPDDRRAVGEAVRVLRPGGRIVLAEHVRSPNVLVRLLERALEPIELRRMADHLLREPLDHVLAEGLDVEIIERHMFGIEERLVARKPEADEVAVSA